MGKYIESPEEFDGKGLALFCAGGITGCPDWQAEMVQLLQSSEWILLNPRRANFPKDNPDAQRNQITWEHQHLRLAKAILFWFPQESICPIVLYELGAWSMTDKLIFVGIHPNYSRRRDVEIQTELVRPDVKIVYSLQELSQQVIEGFTSSLE